MKNIKNTFSTNLRIMNGRTLKIINERLEKFIESQTKYWIIHEKVSNGGTRIECPYCHDTKIVSIYSIYNDTYCSKCGELLRLKR